MILLNSTTLFLISIKYPVQPCVIACAILLPIRVYSPCAEDSVDIAQHERNGENNILYTITGILTYDRTPIYA